MDLRTGIAVIIIGLCVAGSLLLMWRGWRRRETDDADWPALPSPLPGGRLVLGPVAGSYIGTTRSGDWLERVVAHGLARRSTAEVTVTTCGITVERGLEQPVSIVRDAVRAVRIDRAAAGRAVRRQEYLIVTWEYGGDLVDTALRPDHHDDRERLRASIDQLCGEEVTP